jgi:hypothetical protein
MSGFCEPFSVDRMDFPTQDLHQTSSAEVSSSHGCGREVGMRVWRSDEGIYIFQQLLRVREEEIDEWPDRRRWIWVHTLEMSCLGFSLQIKLTLGKVVFI